MKSHQGMLMLFCVLAGWALSSPLRAGIVEPDHYSDGAVLNTIDPQVTLSVAVEKDWIIGEWEVNAVVDLEGHAPTGQMVFGHVNIPFWNSARMLHMDFTQTVESVRIDFCPASSVFGPGYGKLEAYDSTGVLVGSYTTAGLAEGSVDTMSVIRPQGDIAYAFAYGLNDDAFGRLDNLQFAVPEPATLLLTAAGGVLIRWRRKEQG